EAVTIFDKKLKLTEKHSGNIEKKYENKEIILYTVLDCLDSIFENLSTSLYRVNSPKTLLEVERKLLATHLDTLHSYKLILKSCLDTSPPSSPISPHVNS
ncbi:hypothetical protein DID78_07025, partial [Candidatus Marinamargulisbacteria bacterium SCGC AG-343-D04]